MAGGLLWPVGTADGTTEIKPVQLGALTAERVQIVSGLAEGDSLIVYSAKQLDEAMRLAAMKLPIRTKLVTRQEQAG